MQLLVKGGSDGEDSVDNLFLCRKAKGRHAIFSHKLFYHSKYYVIFYILIRIVKNTLYINMEKNIVTIDFFHNILKIVI
jgi:hypothetical protein